MEAFFGILIPFIGTTLSAACVLFMKRSLGDLVQRSLAGFATGVMAAAVWSLSIPAIEQSVDLGSLSFVPVFVGFWAGVLFLLSLDHAIPHLHEGAKSRSPFSAWTRRERLTAAAGSSKPHCLVFLFRKGPLAVSSGCASPTIRRPSGILWRGCPPSSSCTSRCFFLPTAPGLFRGALNESSGQHADDLISRFPTIAATSSAVISSS